MVSVFPESSLERVDATPNRMVFIPMYKNPTVSKMETDGEQIDTNYIENLSACSSITDQSEDSPDDLLNEITYAQLFFDPQTHMLVTLMQASLVRNHLNIKSRHPRFIARSRIDGEEETKDFMSSSSMDELRFNDRTMVTDCSSILSDNQEGPQQLNPLNDSKIWFCNDQTDFSNRNEDHIWLDQSSHTLYLLETSADPWNDGLRKSAGCSETLRKLLMIRQCVSLAHLRHTNGSKPKGIEDRLSYDIHLTTSSPYIELRDD